MWPVPQRPPGRSTTSPPSRCERWPGPRSATSSPSFTADGAAGAVDFGLTTGGRYRSLGEGTEHYLPSFPYLGTPYSGFSNPAVTPVSVAP